VVVFAQCGYGTAPGLGRGAIYGGKASSEISTKNEIDHSLRQPFRSYLLSRRGNVMSTGKLGSVLFTLGVLVTVGAVLWWMYFYGQVVKQLGVNWGEAFQCLFM